MRLRYALGVTPKRSLKALDSLVRCAKPQAFAISGIVFMVVGLCVSIPIALTALTIAYHDVTYPQPTAPGADEA